MRLFPLLRSLIDAPQGNEKELDYPQRRDPRKRKGLLHEPERLFISPCFQQSLGEEERTADQCPGVLALLRERERYAATAHAVVYLPSMHL